MPEVGFGCQWKFSVPFTELKEVVPLHFSEFSPVETDRKWKSPLKAVKVAVSFQMPIKVSY
jgi:hypothetical protein